MLPAYKFAMLLMLATMLASVISFPIEQSWLDDPAKMAEAEKDPWTVIKGNEWFPVQSIEDHPIFHMRPINFEFYKKFIRMFFMVQTIPVFKWPIYHNYIESDFNRHPRLIIFAHTDDDCNGICKEIKDIIKEEYHRAQNHTYEIQ
jgi:hypothetical protein